MIDKDTNCFDAPFLIFIKGITHLSDIQILETLGLNRIKVIDSLEERKSSLYLTRSKNWVHIMDNWLYNLWHKNSFEKKLEELGKKYDIFHCSVGDCDDSFDFVYFKYGKLRRKHIFEDSVFTGIKQVTNDIGEVLSSEKQILEKDTDAQVKIIELAKSIGVEINHKEDDIICYEYSLIR